MERTSPQHENPHQNEVNQNQELLPLPLDLEQPQQLCISSPIPHSFQTQHHQQPHFHPIPARKIPSLLKGIAHILLPAIFCIHFLTTGTVILVYVLALKTPLSPRYVFGAAIAFGGIIFLTIVANGLVCLRRRFCPRDGDEEKGSPASSRSGERVNGCWCVRVVKGVGIWLVRYEQSSYAFRAWRERRRRASLESDGTCEICDDEKSTGISIRKSRDESAGDRMKSDARAAGSTSVGGAEDRGDYRPSVEVEDTDVGRRSGESFKSNFGAARQGLQGSGDISLGTEFYNQAGAVRESPFNSVPPPDAVRTRSLPDNGYVVARQSIATSREQPPPTQTSVPPGDKILLIHPSPNALAGFPDPETSITFQAIDSNRVSATRNSGAWKMPGLGIVEASSPGKSIVTGPIPPREIPLRTSSVKRKALEKPRMGVNQQYEAPNSPPTVALPAVPAYYISNAPSQPTPSAPRRSYPPPAHPLPPISKHRPKNPITAKSQRNHMLKRTSASSETLGKVGAQVEPRTPTSPRSNQAGLFPHLSPPECCIAIYPNDNPNSSHNPTLQHHQQPQPQNQHQISRRRSRHNRRSSRSRSQQRNSLVKEPIAEAEEPSSSRSSESPPNSPQIKGYKTYSGEFGEQTKAEVQRQMRSKSRNRELSDPVVLNSAEKVLLGEVAGPVERRDQGVAVGVEEVVIEDLQVREEEEPGIRKERSLEYVLAEVEAPDALRIEVNEHWEVSLEKTCGNDTDWLEREVETTEQNGEGVPNELIAAVRDVSVSGVGEDIDPDLTLEVENTAIKTNAVATGSLGSRLEPDPHELSLDFEAVLQFLELESRARDEEIE